MNKIEKALRSMGYREMEKKSGKWGKPFAYQLLIAKKVDDEWELTSYFKGNDKLHVWDRKKFADLDELKYAEMELVRLVLNGEVTDFQFETKEEVISDLL